MESRKIEDLLKSLSEDWKKKAELTDDPYYYAYASGVSVAFELLAEKAEKEAWVRTFREQ